LLTAVLLKDERAVQKGTQCSALHDAHLSDSSANSPQRAPPTLHCRSG